ncbi:MAG: UvrD-helicase domain-containing protein, partial [Planctomycetes bacterium]|nr:UvrD-helicase domain-containing protein [Planctomycetota bacterium]
MGFYADLHVHSKYSRATSRDCDLPHIAFWARKKGVAVVGTGDFTHPEWFREIEEQLVPAEPGLFRLRPELEREVDALLGGGSAPQVRFLLQVEISTIYKRGDRTRKVHHLIYVPDLEKARKVRESLERIGNIASDGRPILGLDSRDLLEIALEAGEGCYLVPAHIWTPWFAVLGSKSGFDAIEECYGDLSSEIFAVETGLSSDPAMNRRLSALDRYTLVSNSDAHSPPKIAREACVFETDLDYFAMRSALRTGERYGGTVEFFAEEGKYHYDGHRKCGVCLDPEETRRCGGDCPVCGKPLTLGVMYRVGELADREACSAETDRSPFRSLVPLEEVLAEVQRTGPKSKAVQQRYEQLLSRLGTELFILESAPRADIERACSPLVAEAIARMREGRVIREPGFDGEYGRIRLFEQEELERKLGGALLFEGLAAVRRRPQRQGTEASEAGGMTASAPSAAVQPTQPGEHRPAQVLAEETASLETAVEERTARETAAPEAASREAAGILSLLDGEQRAAAERTRGPLVIIAGPGTGKTRTLTHRIAHIIERCGALPEECLAITFTRRAAGEMRERLIRLLGEAAARIPVLTIHSLGLEILEEHGERLGLRKPLRVAGESERRDLLREALGVGEREARRRMARISLAKREGAVDEIAGDGVETGDPERHLRDDEGDPESCEAGGLEQDHELRGGGALDVRAGGDLASDLAMYDAALRARGWLDFDDLIDLSGKLLEEHSDLAGLYRSRYRWVSVDEVQDIDASQYRLIRLLVAPDGNLCGIGDPDQSIYGFRGADAGCLRRIEADFPATRILHLTTNYRSSRPIVEGALQVIAPSSLVEGRRLEARSGGGAP